MSKICSFGKSRLKLKCCDATGRQNFAEFLLQIQFTNYNKHTKFQVQNLLYSNYNNKKCYLTGIQSIIDQTTRKNFQQKPHKSSCHIFHLTNVCQPKTISSNNKVCSSTLLFKHKFVPNMSFKMIEAEGYSQVIANF